MKTQGEHIRTLRRRVDFLQARDHKNSYDQAELGALEWALVNLPPAQQPQRWAVFCQGCRKEWSVSYPHPGKDICVDCDDKLAQQEPVAVAVHQFRKRGCSDWYDGHPDHTDGNGPYEARTLYTSAPARHGWTTEQIAGMARLKEAQDKKLSQRTWQGLTDEERGQAINANFGTGLWRMAKDAEAKLKEKNNE